MKDEKLEKAARYLRTSAQNDEEASKSLDAQEEYCKEYEAEAGYDVDSAYVYREIGDGSGPDMPELERLLDAAEDGRIKAVIVYRMHLLCRDRVELRNLLQRLNRAGVVVLDAYLRKKEIRGGQWNGCQASG